MRILRHMWRFASAASATALCATTLAVHPVKAIASGTTVAPRSPAAHTASATNVSTGSRPPAPASTAITASGASTHPLSARIAAHALAVSQADTAAAGGAPPAGNAERGRTLFAKVGCAQCHGGEAQGSPTTGPRLGPGSLPFAAFARYVRRPAQQMPPYTDKILSDADLRDIHAFVQSRPKPGTPALLQP